MTSAFGGRQCVTRSHGFYPRLVDEDSCIALWGAPVPSITVAPMNSCCMCASLSRYARVVGWPR